MAKSQASWKSALTPQKAPTYGNQSMLIASPKEIQVPNVDYVVVFEGTKKYHVAVADVVNPWTLHVVIPEHDIAEEVVVKVYTCQDNNLSVLTHLKFSYISQMEHAIAKFLAHSASDSEVAEKLDAVWTVCLGKDHLELWDKRLAQAFAQLELPMEWSLVGDILQSENKIHETLLHFAARHGLKELINVLLDLPGANRALSTYNKSGLLPRDVARESGRLDLVELLDAERTSEQRKSGTFKDSSRRKVRRNNDSGLTTITNLRNHNVQEDIQILRELNKLKSKRNSPVNRHSWPVKIPSFTTDNYIEDLDNELNKVDASNTKQYFMDENLIRLRDITEEIYKLRWKNAEEVSKEISIIADQNRRPAHSRRLSCPASVERHKRSAQGLPNPQSRPESSASERSQGNQEEPANKIPETGDLVFSTPPNSPLVGELIDLSSPTVLAEDTFPSFDDVPESFMTPMSTSPTSSPLPPSPLPISLKYSDVERRPNAGRRDRPRTWYGGPADVPLPDDDDDDLLFRRSNSLEDFAKALEDLSDDESQASEANSREGLLQNQMSSQTEKTSRTESFVSSISEASVGKGSVGSDVDDGELELTQDGDTSEDIKDIDGYEKIEQEHEVIRSDEIQEHKSIKEDLGVVDNHPEIQGVVKECVGIEGGDFNECEEIRVISHSGEFRDVESNENLKLTAGSDVKDIDGYENIKHEHEVIGIDDIQERKDIKEDLGVVNNHTEIQGVVKECEDIEGGGFNECEEIRVSSHSGEFRGVESNENLKLTAGIDIKDIDGYENIEHEHEVIGSDDIQEHKDIKEDLGGVYNQPEIQGIVQECEAVEGGDLNECKEVRVSGDSGEFREVESNENLKRTAGSAETIEQDEQPENRGTEHENKDTEHEGNDVSESVGQNESYESSKVDNIEEQKHEDETERGNDAQTGEPQDCSGQQDTEESIGIIRDDIEKHVQDDKSGSAETVESNAEAETSDQTNQSLEGHVSDNEMSELDDEILCEGPCLELEDDIQQIPDIEDSEDTLLEQKRIGGNQLPQEDMSMTNLSEEKQPEDTKVEEKPEETEVQPHGREDGSGEHIGQPEESEDQPGDLFVESKDIPEDAENQAIDSEVGTDDTEDKSELTDDNSSLCQNKIKFEDINDSECEINDFCLLGQKAEHNKGLFRIQAVDDVESGEDSDQGKHLRFDEKPRSVSPLVEEEKSPVNEDTFSGQTFRQRSTGLLGVKVPVKRTGSDVSVTSLQDVQLNMTHREGSISPGILNYSRKAKSYGDLSTYSEGRSEMSRDDDDDSEYERRRYKEDQAQLSVLSRVKKLENTSRYASNETLEQISKSSVTLEQDEDQGRSRRWSNFFQVRNPPGKPKPPKKPGRTPTFRRDPLRSSMSSIGKKSTIASLVAGPHSASFAKHSQTAPSLQVNNGGRPRSYTGKDSPGAIRKSPTASALELEELKPESPEEVEIPNEEMVFDVDSDLENFDKEPEAWSVTVEKKMLKKMSKNDIKRQDVILELIQTEGHHVRTLKIMQQVFYRGLGKIANYPADRLDELFPKINDLVDISARFYRNLRCRQDENASVQMIGDVIIRQFSGDNGELVRQAYGEFVSKHPEAVALYKHNFKTDKKFSNFIKKCQGHRIVRRLSVPECFTLVTQRMTKYPLLIEAILKVTKSSHADHKELQKALLLVKDATKAVDNAIEDYKKQTRLKEIKKNMEKGSVILKSGSKIKNSRFMEYNSKMIHDGILQWKNARGKLTETHVVLLESMVAFLQENDKKFSLLSIDGKSPCIALKTLMVREVATDKCAIYFVSTSKKGPEMYEFVCSSQKEKKQWLAIITDAIAKAPEDTGDLFHSPEEEKKLAEERLKRRNDLLEMMKAKDKEISDLVDEKNKFVNEMKELWLSVTDVNGKGKEGEKISSNEKARSILLSVINRTTQMTADTILHESHSDSDLAATTYDKKSSSPKRAETFGGFDRRPSQKDSRRLTMSIPEGKPEENHVAQRRDSGLSLASESVVGLNTLSQGQEVTGSTLFQMLEALQWVLVQFSEQETALEKLRAESREMAKEMKKLRSLKIQNDKNQFLMKEEHQAELTRQKKAYSDLERTFNTQVSELKTKLAAQQEQQKDLLKDFLELRKALTGNR